MYWFRFLFFLNALFLWPRLCLFIWDDQIGWHFSLSSDRCHMKLMMQPSWWLISAVYFHFIFFFCLHEFWFNLCEWFRVKSQMAAYWMDGKGQIRSDGLTELGSAGSFFNRFWKCFVGKCQQRGEELCKLLVVHQRTASREYSHGNPKIPNYPPKLSFPTWR